MLVILVGPPGAGKGTQAKQLASYLEITHCSTGEMFREACRSETEIGRKVVEYMNSGRLVPDLLVEQLVAERLGQEDCKDGCLLDGFPRTLVQAKDFDRWSKENYHPINRVVEFKVDEETLLSRLLSRGREDDDEQVIRERFRQYKELTTPLLEYYEDQGVLARIDGIGEIEEVFERIKNVFQTSP